MALIFAIITIVEAFMAPPEAIVSGWGWKGVPESPLTEANPVDASISEPEARRRAALRSYARLFGGKIATWIHQHQTRKAPVLRVRVLLDGGLKCSAGGRRTPTSRRSTFCCRSSATRPLRRGGAPNWRSSSPRSSRPGWPFGGASENWRRLEATCA